MISATPELIALMDSGQFLMADLYDFVTRDGTHYRYSGSDFPVTWNGNTYAVALRLKRNGTKIVRGLEVDALEVTVYPTAADLIGGVPFLQALATGALDGAYMSLYRAYLPASEPLVATGALWRFSGRVSESEFSRTEARITVKSPLELLDIDMPRNLYNPGCIHTLYDSGCTLSAAGFGVNNAASAGSTRTQVNNTLAQAAGYFDQGKVVFNTGANAGVQRTVKSYAPGVYSLALPLPYAPAAGDTFTIFPGCDKTQGTCQAKFNNLPNFRAFPYIPIPEAAI